MESDEEIDREAQLYAFQLSCSSTIHMILKVAIELNLLKIISTFGPNAYVSTVDIASKLPTKNPNAPVMIDRILRFLACYSVVSCSVETLSNGDVQRLYGLAPVCKYLINDDDGVSLAAGCLFNQDNISNECWYHLKDAVLEGGTPFNRAFGMSSFEYQATDARFNKVFSKAMSDHSTLTMKAILKSYKGFENFGSIVDVGGNSGASLNMIISKYPTIKGINFDLPHVIDKAPSYSGVEHASGDMFVKIPKGDAIFMKWILHDWSDEDCLKILQNCYEALPSNGKVIIVECVLGVSPDTSLETKGVVHVDVVMLAHNPGGKERTDIEFQALAKGAGFEGFKVSSGAFATNVIEFSKKI